MGYTTDFNGEFKLNKKLDTETHTFLDKLAETRRMKRNVDAKYGVEGEFYIDGEGFAGQAHEDNVIDHNSPPSTQPSLWLQWRPTDDGTAIEWDGGEKFYEYVEWIEYLIAKILAPRGYTLTGAVQWRGENFDDMGTILIQNNVVTVKSGKHVKLPKAKKAKSVSNEEIELVSHKHKGATYFRADELLTALKLAETHGVVTGLRGMIKEISERK
jgi:hypothetical protein